MTPFLFRTGSLVLLAAIVTVLIACDPGDGATAPPDADAATRLQAVKAKGRVDCATQTDLPGFGYLDPAGKAVGFEVDLCRAVAAAIFGDPDALSIRHVTYAQREELLTSGTVDVLARTTTWSSSHEARWGVFTITMFYDGQGFMVPKSLGAASALDLDGATVCVVAGTGTKLNLEEFFRQHGMALNVVSFEDATATYDAYEQGRCNAATIDKSQLAAVRSTFSNPDAHVILPETISKEPLAPMVPGGDDQWAALVRTVLYVLINAEELGVTQANVEAMRGSDDITIRRMLGVEGAFGQAELGLTPDFAVAVLKAVGNYGEIYNRYLGPQGDAFHLPRGLNNLWSNGGLIYAPPLR